MATCTAATTTTVALLLAVLKGLLILTQGVVPPWSKVTSLDVGAPIQRVVSLDGNRTYALANNGSILYASQRAEGGGVQPFTLFDGSANFTRLSLTNLSDGSMLMIAAASSKAGQGDTLQVKWEKGPDTNAWTSSWTLLRWSSNSSVTTPSVVSQIVPAYRMRRVIRLAFLVGCQCEGEDARAYYAYVMQQSVNPSKWDGIVVTDVSCLPGSNPVLYNRGLRYTITDFLGGGGRLYSSNFNIRKNSSDLIEMKRPEQYNYTAQQRFKSLSIGINENGSIILFLAKRSNGELLYIIKTRAQGSDFFRLIATREKLDLEMVSDAKLNSDNCLELLAVSA